jgi:hypothetical protein
MTLNLGLNEILKFLSFPVPRIRTITCYCWTPSYKRLQHSALVQVVVPVAELLHLAVQ